MPQLTFVNWLIKYPMNHVGGEELFEMVIVWVWLPFGANFC